MYEIVLSSLNKVTSVSNSLRKLFLRSIIEEENRNKYHCKTVTFLVLPRIKILKSKVTIKIIG